VKELTLDGAGWVRKGGAYSAFFHVLGAPEWHGRNLDALRDSILTGSINRVDVP
jgi:RNAse (barnase) inhibitor barstar